MFSLLICECLQYISSLSRLLGSLTDTIQTSGSYSNLCKLLYCIYSFIFLQTTLECWGKKKKGPEARWGVRGIIEDQDKFSVNLRIMEDTFWAHMEDQMSLVGQGMFDAWGTPPSKQQSRVHWELWGRWQEKLAVVECPLYSSAAENSTSSPYSSKAMR